MGSLNRQRRSDRVRDRDKWRGTAAERGYSSRWRREAIRFRKRHPMCAECLKKGITTPSECVDHIVPHRGDETLFWTESNWQALCNECHRSKTRGGQ